MSTIYVARQPILDKNSEIKAYEILYRDAYQESSFDNDRFASASVVNSVLNSFGTKRLLGEKRAFIKIDEKFLLSDIIFSIPKEFFVFLIFSHIKINQAMVTRVKELTQKGYSFGIDNIVPTKDIFLKYGALFSSLDYFKILLSDEKSSEIRMCIGELKRLNMEIIAAKIEDESSFLEAKELGCDYFEGYYFAKPKIMQNREYNPRRAAVLNLYNMLMNEESIDKAADEFEKNPEITVQLLQFVNSAAFHFRKKISSIHHVIVLLGRGQLAKWLMLMIYSKSFSSRIEISPLMLMVKNRTELMERIVLEIHPDAGSNMLGEAYMVGVLSLMDTIFSMPLGEVLENLNISDEVKDALLYDEGMYGDIYKVVRSVESMNINTIVDFEMKYHLAPNRVKNIIMKSIEAVVALELPKKESA